VHRIRRDQSVLLQEGSQNAKLASAATHRARGYGESSAGPGRGKLRGAHEEVDTTSFRSPIPVYLDLRSFGRSARGLWLGVERTVAWICGWITSGKRSLSQNDPHVRPSPGRIYNDGFRRAEGIKSGHGRLPRAVHYTSCWSAEIPPTPVTSAACCDPGTLHLIHPLASTSATRPSGAPASTTGSSRPQEHQSFEAFLQWFEEHGSRAPASCSERRKRASTA